MTDQMTDFEARFADRLQAFAAIPIRDVDELAVAQDAMHSERASGLNGWLAPLRPVMTPTVLLALLVLALLAVALTAGGLLDRLRQLLPGPEPFPFVEELAPATTAQLSSFGAIRLQDGRVLIVGGVDTASGQATVDKAWTFDPATEVIHETGPMTVARADPLLALLPDGRVLVHGGWVDSGEGQQPAVGAELFDPTAGAFTRTADDPAVHMSSPQGALDHAWASPQISTLPDGRLMVSGGTGAGARAQIYDPSVDRFEDVDIGCDATRGTQVRLADGRVLVTCLPDRSSDTVAAVIFDPGTDSFTATGMPSTRGNDNPTLLPDGRVLLTGSSVPADGGADLYDPATGTFTTLPVTGMPDGARGGIDIGGGRFLFLGDVDPEMEMPNRIFDSAALEFVEVDVPGFRIGDPTVRLLDGRLIQLHYQLAATLINPSLLP